MARLQVCAPVDLLRWLTVPVAEPDDWDPFWAALSAAGGPLFLASAARDIVDFDEPFVPVVLGGCVHIDHDGYLTD